MAYVAEGVVYTAEAIFGMFGEIDMTIFENVKEMIEEVKETEEEYLHSLMEQKAHSVAEPTEGETLGNEIAEDQASERESPSVDNQEEIQGVNLIEQPEEPP